MNTGTTNQCGVVAVLGAPNAGKSTLVNALVGQKVAITSAKAQTTRARLLGIALAGSAQIILADTPGIFAPKRRLDRAMVSAAWEGAHAADAVLLLVDPIKQRRHELEPGKLLLHVDFRFRNGGIGTLVMGTHQPRGTPMEWWQVMGDHRRVEVRNLHEVRYFRSPPFKVSRDDATLADGQDTLVWEPNFTVAANEDHKGYHAILGDFVRAARGEKLNLPDAAAGARALGLLEQAIASAEASE